jgi:hypothetical protein
MKAVTLHHSLARAMKLLAMVNKDWKTPVEATAYCWDNGREQGLALRVTDKTGKSGTVFVAEARASDETVVVTDPDPEPFNNKPSEEAWTKHRRYFPLVEVTETVRYIRESLRRLVEQCETCEVVHQVR